MEVAYNLIERLFHAVEGVGKEIEYTHTLALEDALHARILFEIHLRDALIDNHVVQALVCELRRGWALSDDLEILEHASLPHALGSGIAVFLDNFLEIHALSPLQKLRQNHCPSPQHRSVAREKRKRTLVPSNYCVPASTAIAIPGTAHRSRCQDSSQFLYERPPLYWMRKDEGSISKIYSVLAARNVVCELARLDFRNC